MPVVNHVDDTAEFWFLNLEITQKNHSIPEFIMSFDKTFIYYRHIIVVYTGSV